MRITTLAENMVSKHDLLGEHGLSFILETDDEIILFDTGQGYTILHNAQKLGIDLSKVQKIVLSHGHYDHTGGLMGVLGVIKDANIFGHPDIFDMKYSKDDKKIRYIGLPFTREDLESKGAKFNLSRNSIQIAAGIWTTGEIKRQIDFEVSSDRLCVMGNDRLEKDSLMDDLSLVINSQKGVVVVLGCCHSGIINTLLHIQKMTDNAPISMLIGGIHLVDATDEKIDKTIRFLSDFDIKKLALCHCTGMKAMMRLYQAFGDKLMFNSVGTLIEL